MSESEDPALSIEYSTVIPHSATDRPTDRPTQAPTSDHPMNPKSHATHHTVAHRLPPTTTTHTHHMVAGAPLHSSPYGPHVSRMDPRVRVEVVRLHRVSIQHALID